MAIVQEMFDIPDNIMIGIEKGLYRRIGGVVRYATGPKKGQIIDLLDPIDAKPVHQVQSLGAKTLKFVKINKKPIIISSVMAVAITTGVYIYKKAKKTELKIVTKFRDSLKEYIEEIRKGKLTLESINNLIDSLEELRSNKEKSDIKIALSMEELNALVVLICEYTSRLAEMNKYKVNASLLNKSDDSIENMYDCLLIQKHIFESAA